MQKRVLQQINALLNYCVLLKRGGCWGRLGKGEGIRLGSQGGGRVNLFFIFWEKPATLLTDLFTTSLLLKQPLSYAV